MYSKVNRYILADDVKDKFVPIVETFIDKVAKCNAEEKSRYDVTLDLTGSELNPYTLGELLEKEFGYRHEDTETNGWQIDFWSYYTHDTKPLLCVSGCGMTFELILRGDDDDTKEYEDNKKEDNNLMKLIDEGLEIIKKTQELLKEYEQ